ncbi:hypothetical protein Lalb_Chr01g0006211 [Lupinus albus]|uniref:Uncharacterized protein n=1 Tax=Lupinus albus TaxID=3870 RepID=A0A6A4R608_LUPAL|nr:hypothetical protein Lalb_Chr01g0006211 [Lupinus albus]
MTNTLGMLVIDYTLFGNRLHQTVEFERSPTRCYGCEARIMPQLRMHGNS